MLKRGAATRRIPLEISIDEAWEMFVSNGRSCALSGVAISFGSWYLGDNVTASLDRIDSGGGYTKANSQWVHKTVNKMKWDLPDHQFISLCVAVANWTTGAAVDVPDFLAPPITSGRERKFKKEHGEIAREQWIAIQHGARYRGLPFEISPSEAWDLFTRCDGRCALTGARLSLGLMRNKTASLDRIDPSRGYVPGNVQWLHKIVNISKANHAQSEFVFFCMRIADKRMAIK